MSHEPAPTIVAPPPGLWANASHGGGSQLEKLAARFWPPVYSWLRAVGDPPESAVSHAKMFFTRLSKLLPVARDESLAARFREFMLASLKSWLAEGLPPEELYPGLQIDAEKAEVRFGRENLREEDEMYVCRLALCVLEAAMNELREEFASSGQTELFSAMKPFLGFSPAADGYATAAQSVKISASAFHMQVFNFRKRYRTILRSHIADIVRHSDDVDSELTVLLVAAS